LGKITSWTTHSALGIPTFQEIFAGVVKLHQSPLPNPSRRCKNRRRDERGSKVLTFKNGVESERELKE
jgi:hypothetical protein